MIDIMQCPALDPGYEDYDGCSLCGWEVWYCREAALAKLAELNIERVSDKISDL